MMQKLIVVTGKDGSGKSTLVDGIAQLYPEFHVASIWDAMKFGLFQSKKDIDDYLCKLSADARLLFLSHALEQSIEIAKESKADTVLMNAYYYKYFASELTLGASENLVKSLIEFFPKADLVINLEIEEELALSRKQSLSKYECGVQEQSDKAFLSFQKLAGKQWSFFDQSTWYNINAISSIEEIKNKALEIIS
ncbi:hypothetical protein K6119_10920 [Paracrocinitomix mangrovi]|uniref:hypothetical protein n=1 Tax=Paracrocinitomix mangrovi TaxID=2862509 RepID=UPI001C8E1787|nr:hypothetical protein [Paracrocinitomix mangrovi]UKN00245.1 hypothetical protein K6119_10920 [Paracrocinitomix mangrovi]